jgi:hypothetical protein
MNAIQGVNPDTDREGLDFLRPAQQPDELGRLEWYRFLKKLGAGGMGIVSWPRTRGSADTSCVGFDRCSRQCARSP